MSRKWRCLWLEVFSNELGRSVILVSGAEYDNGRVLADEEGFGEDERSWSFLRYFSLVQSFELLWIFERVVLFIILRSCRRVRKGELWFIGVESYDSGASRKIFFLSFWMTHSCELCFVWRKEGKLDWFTVFAIGFKSRKFKKSKLKSLAQPSSRIFIKPVN